MFSAPKQDFLASIVVFLVALPLCMGIAIASGAPVATGLITGIVGGLIVGVLSGAPLQVSGPAAGLTVIVYPNHSGTRPRNSGSHRPGGGGATVCRWPIEIWSVVFALFHPQSSMECWPGSGF